MPLFHLCRNMMRGVFGTYAFLHSAEKLDTLRGCSFMLVTKLDIYRELNV